MKTLIAALLLAAITSVAQTNGVVPIYLPSNFKYHLKFDGSKYDSTTNRMVIQMDIPRVDEFGRSIPWFAQIDNFPFVRNSWRRDSRGWHPLAPMSGRVKLIENRLRYDDFGNLINGMSRYLWVGSQ